MNSTKSTQGSRIMPTLRYRDVGKAIDWLEKAFGFEKHAAHADESGSIVHAELKKGADMIMLGAARDDAFGKLQTMPDQTGGQVTQSAYIIVPDVPALHDHVQRLGARIVMPLSKEPYGTMFSCLDLEGHLWNFGDYDPRV